MDMMTCALLKQRSRLTSLNAPGKSVTFTWDENNNRTQMQDASGTTSWVYDANNRVTSETTGRGTVSFGYDAVGNRTSGTNTDNQTTSYSYNARNDLVQVNDPWNGVTNCSYDADRNLTYQQNPNYTQVDQMWDNADRLVTVLWRTAAGQAFARFDSTYNREGNISVCALHRLTSEVRTGTGAYNISDTYDPLETG